MYSIRLDIKDSVFDKVIYFLNNLPKDDVVIVEENFLNKSIGDENMDSLETKAFSNHSAEQIREWEDASEDEIWI